MQDDHSKMEEIISLGDHKVLQAVLQENPATINTNFSKGRSLLHIAVGKGQASCVKILLEMNLDVNKTDNMGNTALHYCGHEDILQLLLQSGIDKSFKNKRGDTALSLIRRKGIKHLASKLMESTEEECTYEEEHIQDENNRNIIFRLDPNNENETTHSTSSKNILDEFCEDLGSTKLIILLGLIFVFSMYIALSVTGFHNLFDSRILVSNDQARKIEL